MIARFAEFLAQAIDVGVDGASLQRGLNLPYFLQKLVASLDASEPAHQEVQEAELEQGQRDDSPFHPAPMLHHVQSARGRKSSKLSAPARAIENNFMGFSALVTRG